MKNKLKIKNILSEVDPNSYAGAFPNKEIISDALEEIDKQLKEISAVVLSTNDPESKRKFDAAMKFISKGFDLIEEMDV